MNNENGVFIVLEGADGSGKTTQFNLLRERLEAVGHNVKVYKFPQYDKPSSHFVRSYLDGDYGPASEISPYTASTFYALDRYEASSEIRKSLLAGQVILSDRYVGANMAHQGSKFTNEAEQRGFFVWEDSLEFQLLNIPRPTITLFLRVPATVSQKLIIERSRKTGAKLDEHEKDLNHLTLSVATYDRLCQLFPKDFTAVECTENGKMLDIPAISDRIWAIVKPILPQQPQNSPKSKVVSLRSDSDGAAAQEAILPTAQIKKAQQNYELMLKDASGLVERTVAPWAQIYLQTQTVRPKDSNFRYYIPKVFSPELAKEYKTGLKQIERSHQELARLIKQRLQTKEQALPELIPLAKLAVIALKGSGNDLADLAESLQASSLEEFRLIAKTSLTQLKSDSSSSRAPDVGKMLSQLTQKLPQSLESGEEVHLAVVWPKNEFDILTDLLYSESNVTMESLSEEISTWTFKQKTEALKDFLSSANPNIKTSLKGANYRWNFVSSGVDMLTMLGLSQWHNVRIQPATPRYGYDIPEQIEQGGLEEEYSECFDVSLSLYSKLQAAGHLHEAQYAVLGGHKACWQADINGLSLKYLLNAVNTQQSRSITSLISAMQEAAVLHHPVLYSLDKSTQTKEVKSDIAPEVNHKPVRGNERGSSSKVASSPSPKRRRRGRPRSKK